MLYAWIFGYKVSKSRLLNQLEIAVQGGYSWSYKKLPNEMKMKHLSIQKRNLNSPLWKLWQ